MEIRVMLDSGAHSLFNLHARDTGDFSYYETDDFWSYVDRYANFVKTYINYIDLYVNVDVIKNPELSWKVQCYLEDTHGLAPLPVIHHGTNLKWIKRYLDRYEYIGLGGVASGARRQDFYSFADEAFSIIGDSNGVPRWKIHGFAMTAFAPLLRYPFYSVDSTAWVKTGRLGSIYVPRQTKDSYDYTRIALKIPISYESPKQSERLNHFQTLPNVEQEYVLRYLSSLGLTLEQVSTSYRDRDFANVKYFENLCKQLPEWPWAFNLRKQGLSL